MNEELVRFIREIFKSSSTIPLHAPVFLGNEKKYLAECIDSTFVSYVGPFVTKLEEMLAAYTGAKYAVATVNGTAALHLALHVLGVRRDDLVLTQDLTFVATVNAISYTGARPLLLDSDRDTLGMSAEDLQEYLETRTEMHDDGFCYDRGSRKRIPVCMPVHIFGHPCRIDKISELCRKKNIVVLEDAAESLGSFFKGRHTGTFGKIGVISFNGNKTVTTGGGGVLLTDDETLAQRARHLSTTAKVPHRWEFIHDEVGYNYRMPNINAAVGCAQMETLDRILENKRELAALYREFCAKRGIGFIDEPKDSKSNFWLNAIAFEDRSQRDSFLEFSNGSGVMTRPVWTLSHKLPMYENCVSSGTPAAQWLEDRLVNIPSSVRA